LQNIYQKLDVLVRLKIYKAFGHKPMCNWIALDEEWQQRTKRLLQRCMNESNGTKSQLMLERAYQSESRRLEWQYCYKEYKDTLNDCYSISTDSVKETSL